MVAALVAAFASVVGIATTVICVSFWSGKLTQQIADNKARIDEHDDTLKDHNKRISDHDVEIGNLVAWRNGYNAALAKPRAPEENNG